jgi:hypothetical protein
MSCCVTAGRSAPPMAGGHSSHAPKISMHNLGIIRGIGLSLRQWFFPATLLYDK